MFMIRNEAHSFMTAADVSIVPRFEPVNDAWMEKKNRCCDLRKNLVWSLNDC